MLLLSFNHMKLQSKVSNPKWNLYSEGRLSNGKPLLLYYWLHAEKAQLLTNQSMAKAKGFSKGQTMHPVIQ